MSVAPDSGSQAPVGGALRRLLGPLHVTGSFWYRFHLFGVRALPAWAIGPVILVFTTFFFVALRRIRGAIAANLRVVLGSCGWWERQRRIFRTMRNLAWSLSERYESLSGSRETDHSVSGREHLDPLFGGERGFVIATAHIGNWETSLFDPGASRDRRVHVVREEEGDPQAQAFVRGLIEARTGSRMVVHFARGEDVALATRLLAGLREGDLVALQGDRPRSGGRALPVRIFGRELLMPVGPAALARAAGVPVLPVFAFRRGRLRTEIVCRKPIEVPRSADGNADLQAAVEAIGAEVEWAIRSAPFQWFCFRDLWGPGAQPVLS